MKLFAVKAEAAYRFRSRWDVSTPYLGSGLGANIKSVDNGGNNSSQTDLGVNLLDGIEKGLSNGDRLFIEWEVQPERHARRQGHGRLDVLTLAVGQRGAPSVGTAPLVSR